MPLHCDRCQTALPEAVFNTPEPVACPACLSPLLVRVFPAYRRAPVVGRAAETIGSDEDASCFFHPRKKAVVPCGQCGRFLCALCDLEIDGRHLCPSCATMPKPAAGAGELTNERFLHDQLALILATVPLIVWPLTLFTAPAALFYAVKYWNEPARSLIPRSQVTAWAALLLALVEIAGWSVLGCSLISDLKIMHAATISFS